MKKSKPFTQNEREVARLIAKAVVHAATQELAIAAVVEAHATQSNRVVGLANLYHHAFNLDILYLRNNQQ